MERYFGWIFFPSKVPPPWGKILGKRYEELNEKNMATIQKWDIILDTLKEQ